MTLLHVYFALRDQQAFQRLLERDRSPAANPHAGQSVGTSSAGKSWTRKHIASALEVNAFDSQGRTVLHLACSSTEPASLEYARMLLAHLSVNVNLSDKENHWTALHRAMYAGNIEAAIMLLKRTDTDTSIKDAEGYTAFDLYNSTVRSANPTSLEDGCADLLTWGANRNAALGLGDGNDRTHPDHVTVSKRDIPIPASYPLEERFRPIKVQDVRMSRLHTVILTDESRDNVRLCGFGSGGRLGSYSHTLYTPTPLSLSSNSIVSVALGQDHTLALTMAGEILSWGLNRFAQLGYVVESGQGGSADELVQTTPRKIVHLKKEFINGIAACKTASACWSNRDVWTWGTNSGQLGYSKTASPIQVLPRKVSVITQPIRGISMSEMAMMCLFVTGEVICVWNGGASKINFPAHAFPSDISTIYRPPQAMRGPAITKLVCCDELFAALSSNGEVFTFSHPTVNEGDGAVSGAHAGGSRGQVKPQRVWALRRQWSSVRDVDIGGDGALIICTQSGHVYVRSRNLKGSGSKAFKFHRIAHAQRAVTVCANSTGAFGALRVDYRPSPIDVTGRPFSADMAAIAPFMSDVSANQDKNLPLLDANMGADDDVEDSSILDDIGEMAKLMSVLRHQINHAELPVKGDRYGADLAVRVGLNFEVPAHRVILAARCVPLRQVLGGNGDLCDTSSKVTVTFSSQWLDAPLAPPILHFTGINPLSMLILLHYLYSDGILAVWDRRIGLLFEEQLSILGLSVTQVKVDLAILADILRLPHLTSTLQYVGKCVPKSSASGDFRSLFEQAQPSGSSRRDVRQDPLAPDVAIHLADKIVYAHSAILRARSIFFAALFADPDWTTHRRDEAGVISVEMGHCKWQVMQFVFAFVCFGEEALFEKLEWVSNIDELLEFMFLVVSAANELLLTRLVLLCSRIVLKYLNPYNACYLLTEAIHFNAMDLADRVQNYMAANMEMLLESRILDDLDTRVVRKLSEHTYREQMAQSPVSRSNKLGRAALEKHKEWLASQDIPVPIIPSAQKLWSVKDSPKMSPPGSTKKSAGRPLMLYSPSMSPSLRPQQQPPQGDEIFAMDAADDTVTSNSAQPASVGEEGFLSSSTTTAAAGLLKPGWKKNPATPRTDLKAIMAEAENGKRQTRTPDSSGQGAILGSSWKSAGLSPSASPNMHASMGGRLQGTSSPSTPRRVPSDLTLTPRPEPTPSYTTQATPSTSQASPGPWRPDTSSTPRRLISEPATPPKPEPVAGTTPSRTTTNIPARASQTMMPTAPGLSRPIMGPVIKPVRQTSGASGSSVKPSLGGAWTLPPVQPIAAPTVPSSATLSFAEIQRLQEQQGTMSTAMGKRSLRDIQEEERARQQEVDFLKWWAAEEERVRLEKMPEGQGQGKGKGKGQGRTGGAGATIHPSSSKNKGKQRKAKSEKDLSNVVTQQRESRGH